MERETTLTTKDMHDKALAALANAESYAADATAGEYAQIMATVGLGYATLFAARKPTS